MNLWERTLAFLGHKDNDKDVCLLTDDPKELEIDGVIRELEESGDLRIDRERVDRLVEECINAKRNWKHNAKSLKETNELRAEREAYENRSIEEVASDARKNWRYITG